MAARNAEEKRLDEARRNAAAWRRWGPYLSARQWGTAGDDFAHEHARSRAYRNGEDGIAGICDDEQRLCFGLALWNGVDPILKERFFGSSAAEGNHGEDAKEYWFHADATPTHSYLKLLYKYPMAAFPYDGFAAEAKARGPRGLEPELIETGIFANDRYWDVEVEYAKASPDDVLVRITAHNRSPERATLHLLPQIWFRNTWSADRSGGRKPRLEKLSALGSGFVSLEASHATLGDRWLHAECAPVKPDFLFTENETNEGPDHVFAKDAIGERVVRGRARVNPGGTGTKAAVWYRLEIDPGKSAQICLRLRDDAAVDGLFGAKFDRVFEDRRREAEEHWKSVEPPGLVDETRALFRQSLASLLWSQQHLGAENAIACVPDKWEQPALSAWDVALLAVPLALVDVDLAQRQVLLALGDGHLHTGETPPLLAWAAMRIHETERRRTGWADRGFLQVSFHKLLLQYGSWADRRDAHPGWMAGFALGIFAIAVELAKSDPAFEESAVTFLDCFAKHGDAFHADVQSSPHEMASLVPLLAIETVETSRLESLPALRARLDALAKERPGFVEPGPARWRIGLLSREQRASLLHAALDESGLLSPFGIRSLSKRHPDYEPAESRSASSNVSRSGAVWLSMNALVVDALSRAHDDLTVELPSGSGVRVTLAQAAADLSRRLHAIFLRSGDGRRPVHGGAETLQSDVRWRDHHLFYECFHGDEGAGLGASHCASAALLAWLMVPRG